MRVTTRDDVIVLISETNSLLTSMLDGVGVRPGKAEAVDVPTMVRAFQRFAAIPVDDAASPEDDGDGILAQFGTFTFDGLSEFSADLTRQLIEADDEDAMWQLHCTLHWTPDAETEALGSGLLWSFGRPLDDFFTEVLTLPGWVWALAGGQTPRHLTVELEQI